MTAALMRESADRLNAHCVQPIWLIGNKLGGWQCVECGMLNPRSEAFLHAAHCPVTRLRSAADQRRRPDADLAEADACIARYFPAAKIDTVQADTWRAIQRHKVRTATTDRGE